MKERRYSRQREEIYQVLCASKEHPTAQMVYDVLRADLPNLSLGTVYRNLQQMVEEGRLVEISGPVTRYDATVKPHTHLRCTCCGQVADGALPYDAALDQSAAEEGWVITRHNLMFTGMCPACAGK